METPGAAPEGLVTLSEIEAAAERISEVAVWTPLLPFPELSDERGGEIRLKCESLQRTGAFKIRGAYNFLSRLSRDELKRGVITYSSGNHGQAVALAARLLGARAIVVMPTTAPAVKVEGAKRLGAEVHFAGTLSHHRQAKAESLAGEKGLTVIPPFDHPWIIAGQATVGREIAMDWPEVDVVLAPIGGGGLSSGVATAVKTLLPDVRFVGVEPEGAPRMTRALEAGGPVSLDQVETVADGLRTIRAGDHTFRHIRAFVDEVVQVSDDAILEAASLLLMRRKLVVEVSGAAALAGILSGAVNTRGKRVAVVLSGGNLDLSHMESLARDDSAGVRA
jgi:threonine dehydratase